jgi:hypothetical protein
MSARASNPQEVDLHKFYVITIISNPVRYNSRYDLYWKFANMCTAAEVKLITVEQAFGDRPFVVTDRDNPMHLQVRSEDELWHKENMINLGINYLMQLDPDAKYVAWVDADVFPMMPPRQWFLETYHALQHYQVVQMFEYAQDLDPRFNPIGNLHMGFMAAWVNGGYKLPDRSGYFRMGCEKDYYTRHGHPGYAWAATVEALSHLGGLIDKSILGAGDRHMALSLVGAVAQSIPQQMSEGYVKTLTQWQERAARWIKRDVGYVGGTITHYWHGKKVNRGYVDRWKILIDNVYDPNTDLKKDAQGLYQLETYTDRQIMLRDQIRTYFRSRNEDDIST